MIKRLCCASGGLQPIPAPRPEPIPKIHKVTNRLRAHALESRWFDLWNSAIDHGGVAQIDAQRRPLSLGQLHLPQHCAETVIASERS
jgi:hypothetical protein